MYPCIEINLNKIETNARRLNCLFKPKGISIMAVTKGFSGEPKIARAILKGGAEYIADARIQNLIKLKDLPKEKVLLRLPMISEIHDVVKYCDYSLNSELETLREIGKVAKSMDTVHKVIIMVDLGDYREGIRYHRVEQFVKEAIGIEAIAIRGFGVNLTCFGGVIPEQTTLLRLVEISESMKVKFDLTIDLVSGGSSSSVYLLNEENGFPQGINTLRLGEVMLLGKETAFGKRFDGLHEDAFILKAQIIELKDKPSVPHGMIGRDAFGNVPKYEDRGIIRRAIVALGKQDVDPSGIIPVNPDISILGASSDHLILDLSKDKYTYQVGDIVHFYVKYGGMLNAMTSPYVEKVYIEDNKNGD
ncbi:MAG TPA: alanine/ornithine racemase family PLP-dependent enzyme, partial [Bacteroidales bacterium]|nr:alanine/ornithine racemase family PLP-dependent enzyme [Bacteroidales bacterium]